MRKTFSLWTETGAWWLSSWVAAVWSLSGRQIQRYFPSNIHCNTKVVHTAQVRALEVFVGFLKGSLSYYFCTFILEYWPRSVRPRHFRKWIQLSLTSVMKSRRPYWLVTSQRDCTYDDLWWHTVGFLCQTGTEEWFSIKKGLHQPMTKVNILFLWIFDLTACVFTNHSLIGLVGDCGCSLQVYRRGAGRCQTQQGCLESGVCQVWCIKENTFLSKTQTWWCYNDHS